MTGLEASHGKGAYSELFALFPVPRALQSQIQHKLEQLGTILI